VKRLAYVEEKFESEIVSVHEALKLKKKCPEKWEHAIFYDLIGLRPMKAVDRGYKSSSFSFLNGVGSGHGNGSKGIAHELVQEYICKLKFWKVRLYGKNFNIRIESAIDEYLIQNSQQGRKYYVDCFLKLYPSSDLYNESGGMIGIEVTDTHAVGLAKRKALWESGKVILELKMIEDWHVPNDKTLMPDDLHKLRARIRGFLKKGTYLGCICKPPDLFF